MTTAQHILASLDERRRALGMSMPVLARRTGLCLSTLYRVLRGRKNAGLEAVTAIADALGIRVSLTHPRQETAMRKEQAQRKARVLVGTALGSASIEHPIGAEKVVRQIARAVEGNLLSSSNLALWH